MTKGVARADPLVLHAVDDHDAALLAVALEALLRQPLAGRLPLHVAEADPHAVLPAGAGLLEVVQHLAVDAQGDLFPGARDRRPLGRRLGGLCGRGLERFFGSIASRGRSSYPVVRHVMTRLVP